MGAQHRGHADIGALGEGRCPVCSHKYVKVVACPGTDSSIRAFAAGDAAPSPCWLLDTRPGWAVEFLQGCPVPSPQLVECWNMRDAGDIGMQECRGYRGARVIGVQGLQECRGYGNGGAIGMQGL